MNCPQCGASLIMMRHPAKKVNDSRLDVHLVDATSGNYYDGNLTHYKCTGCYLNIYTSADKPGDLQ